MDEYYKIPKNITSFEQIIIPKNITKIDCRDRGFTSFIGCPDHITHIDCDFNYITSFEHLPNSLILISCGHNKINNFDYLPSSVKYIWLYDNPCYDLYKSCKCNLDLVRSYNILDIKDPGYD